jgi:hypothetical protein
MLNRSDSEAVHLPEMMTNASGVRCCLWPASGMDIGDKSRRITTVEGFYKNHRLKL